jgi:hypothetical protein
MLKKPIHNHYNNQTNPKNHPKPKNKPQNTAKKEVSHAKLLQQQPKRKNSKNKEVLTQISQTPKLFKLGTKAV